MIRRRLVNVVRTDRATLLCIIALIILPVAMFAVNRSYIYTYPGELDPWVYAGYHLHLPAMWRFAPWAYYGTRVPYTALGYVVNGLFGTEPSLYILAALQFYAATFSLFYTIRVLFQSPVAGFLAACVLGTNSWFLWAIGWKYIDGPSIACVLFSFAALTAAARQKHWRTALLVWGAAMAATAALYLMYVVLLPVEIVAFVVLNWFGSRRPILPAALLLCAGIVGNIFLMGVVNWALGGSFDYFRPTLNVLASVGSPAEAAAYYAPWHVWIFDASWFLVPAFAFIAGWVVIATLGPSLLRRWKSELTSDTLSDAGLVALALACVLAVSGFLFMQARHYNVVQIFYHESILLPFAFLAIGGCFARGLSRLQSGRGLLAIAACGILLCLAPWIATGLGYFRVPLPATSQVGFQQSWLLMAAPLLLGGTVNEPLWVLAGAGLLIAGFAGRHWLLPFAATAFLSIVSVATIPGFNIDAGPFKPLVRDQSLIIYDIARFIDDERGNRPIAFWWPQGDAKLPLFESLGEMYIWNPYVPPVIPPDGRVVFVTSGSNLNALERAFSANQQMGLRHLKAVHFQRGIVGIDVAIADVYEKQLPAVKASGTTRAQPSIPLLAFAPRTRPAPILIKTPPGAWQYAAEEPFPDSVRQLGLTTAYLHVRLRVNNGVIGVGVTTTDGSTFLNRKFYTPTRDPQDVYIDIPRFQTAMQIVVCNGDTRDSSSVKVYSVDLYTSRPNPE